MVSAREACILRELVRSAGYIDWLTLADAAAIGGQSPRARQVTLNRYTRKLRAVWGPIIETRRANKNVRLNGGYRLTDYGRKLIGGVL